MNPKIYTFEFVEYIPENIKENVLYISIKFATVVHNCACGCGREVVTPLSPVDWSLIFDGVSISLNPSIGNWSFPCQSHYWIKKNRIIWAAKLSQETINAGRKFDSYERTKYYSGHNSSSNNHSIINQDKKRLTFLFKVKRLLENLLNKM